MLYLNLLLKFWREAAMAALLIALGALYVYNATLQSNLARAESALTIERQNVAVLNTSLKSATDSLERQNAAIEQMRREADAKVARSAEELRRARALANGFKLQAEGLLNTPLDPTLSLCDNANVLINKEIKRAKGK